MNTSIPNRLQSFAVIILTFKTETNQSLYQHNVAELRSLAEHCQFGAQLNNIIQDRLVCGINDQRIQCLLLQEPDLMYNSVYNLALAMETASKDVSDLLKKLSTSDHSKSAGESPWPYNLSQMPREPPCYCMLIPFPLLFLWKEGTHCKGMPV